MDKLQKANEIGPEIASLLPGTWVYEIYGGRLKFAPSTMCLHGGEDVIGSDVLIVVIEPYNGKFGLADICFEHAPTAHAQRARVVCPVTLGAAVVADLIIRKLLPKVANIEAEIRETDRRRAIFRSAGHSLLACVASPEPWDKNHTIHSGYIKVGPPDAEHPNDGLMRGWTCPTIDQAIFSVEPIHDGRELYELRVKIDHLSQELAKKLAHVIIEHTNGR